MDCRLPGSSLYCLAWDIPGKNTEGGCQYSPGDLCDPGIKPASPVAPALAGGFFTTEPPGKPHVYSCYVVKRVGLKPQCLGPNCGPMT